MCFLAFREMILTSEASPKSKGKRTSQAQLQKETKQRLSAPNSDVNGMPPVINSSHKDKSKDKIVSLASNQKPNKLLRAFKAFSILPRNRYGHKNKQYVIDNLSYIHSYNRFCHA